MNGIILQEVRLPTAVILNNRRSVMLWGKPECVCIQTVRTLISVNLKSNESTAERNQNSIKTKNKKEIKK